MLVIGSQYTERKKPWEVRGKEGKTMERTTGKLRFDFDQMLDIFFGGI